MRESSIFLFEHDLFGKPVPTFPDHALMARILIAKADATFTGTRAEPTGEPAVPPFADVSCPDRASCAGGQAPARHRRSRHAEGRQQFQCDVEILAVEAWASR